MEDKEYKEGDLIDAEAHMEIVKLGHKVQGLEQAFEDYLEATGRVRTDLWNAIYLKYPQLIGHKLQYDHVTKDIIVGELIQEDDNDRSLRERAMKRWQEKRKKKLKG